MPAKYQHHSSARAIRYRGCGQLIDSLWAENEQLIHTTTEPAELTFLYGRKDALNAVSGYFYMSRKR